MSDVWLSPTNNSNANAIREVQLSLGLHQSGQYDVRLSGAVADFQGANGLKTDGVVGPETWSALTGQVPVTKKKAPAKKSAAKKAAPEKEATAKKKAPAKKKAASK